MLRSQLCRARGDLADAEAWARRAVEVEDLRPETHNELGEVLFLRAEAAERAGDRAAMRRLDEAALESYERSLAREPRQFHVLLRCGVLLLRAMPESADGAELLRFLVDHATEARERLDDAIDLIPRSPQAHNNRAIALLRLGTAAQARNRLPEAEELLEDALASSSTALEIRPDYAIGWANKAYTLWKLGRLDEAYDAVLRAREIDPDYRFHSEFSVAMALAGHTIPREGTSDPR